MAEFARKYRVTQTKFDVVRLLDRARDRVENATIELEPRDGNENDRFTVTFWLSGANYDKDGSQLYVGVTDLGITINIYVDCGGTVTARLPPAGWRGIRDWNDSSL